MEIFLNKRILKTPMYLVWEDWSELGTRKETKLPVFAGINKLIEKEEVIRCELPFFRLSKVVWEDGSESYAFLVVRTFGGERSFYLNSACGSSLFHFRIKVS